MIFGAAPPLAAAAAAAPPLIISPNPNPAIPDLNLLFAAPSNFPKCNMKPSRTDDVSSHAPRALVSESGGSAGETDFSKRSQKLWRVVKQRRTNWASREASFLKDSIQAVWTPMEREGACLKEEG